MAQLICIIGDCPIEGMVDWRRCRNCSYYDGMPEAGVVNCNHPQADPSNIQAERWKAMQTSRDILHIILCG